MKQFQAKKVIKKNNDIILARLEVPGHPPCLFYTKVKGKISVVEYDVAENVDMHTTWTTTYG